ATVIGGLVLFRRHVEQAACLGDVVGARAAGEQSVVADAVEARRQDVDQESADELGGSECHDLLALATFGPIVLPSEGDAGAVAGNQSAIGDGDAVGIARQIGQHGVWPAERALGIDHPFGAAQWREIRGERLCVSEGGVAAEELQLAGFVAAISFSRNSRRNKRESTRTGRKKPGRHATQRSPSSAMPPPGTIIWTCG